MNLSVGKESRVTIEYKIEFISPFHIGTGFGLAGVLDSRLPRDSDGFVYIPGSSFKGRLKPVFRRLLELLAASQKIDPCLMVKGCEGDLCDTGRPCLACYVFGNSRQEGRIRFGDARLSATVRNELVRFFEEYPFPRDFFDSQHRTSVMISRKYGTAEPARLFTFELGRPGLELYGSLVGRLGMEGCVKIVGRDIPLGIPLLAAAMRGVKDLGGGNSRGWGACRVSLERVWMGGENIKCGEKELFEAMEGW